MCVRRPVGATQGARHAKARRYNELKVSQTERLEKFFEKKALSHDGAGASNGGSDRRTAGPGAVAPWKLTAGKKYKRYNGANDEDDGGHELS